MKTIKILVLFLMLLSGKAWAQRVEIEQKKLGENPQVVAIGKDGLIVFYETKMRVPGGRREWIFTKYDTLFREVWTKEFAVDRNRDFAKYDLEQDFLHVFMTSTRKDFTILSLRLSDGQIHTTDSQVAHFASFQDFNVVDNHALITGRTLPSGGQSCLQGLFKCTCIPAITGATVYKTKPIVYSVDLKKAEAPLKWIDFSKFKGNGAALVSQPTANGKQLDCMISQYENKNVPPLIYIRRFNTNLTDARKTNLKPDQSYELLNGKLSNLNDSEQIVIGSYSYKPNSHRFRISDPKTAWSNGMYFGKIENGKQQFMKYYEFKQFSFYQRMLDDWSLYNSNNKYANMRRRERLEKQSVSYYLLVHEPVEQDSGYVVVAETYILSYHTECRTTYSGSNNTPTQTCYQVFDGYNVTGAIIAGFNKDGTKKWDNYVSVTSWPTMNLKYRVDVLPGNGETILTYAYNGNLEKKTIKGNTVSGMNSFYFDFKNEASYVKYNVQTDVSHWYDRYYIAFGFGRVKDYNSGWGSGKNIFYFNKIDTGK